MRPILTSEQMRALERRAMDSGRVGGWALMARAGAQVALHLAARWPDLPKPARVAVLCGPGNNGGDGFVVARHLKARGHDVQVLALPTRKRGHDAARARHEWRKVGGRSVPLTQGAVAGLEVDLIVDALFGIGLRRPLGGGLAEVVAALARHRAGDGRPPRVLAIDLPSGLDADTGCILRGAGAAEDPGAVLPADLTVTFDSPKPGHLLAQGPQTCGALAVADIGIAAWREAPSLRQVPARAAGDATHPARAFLRNQGHKYDHGHALVLSGGMGRTGAARLAARAALRGGAGLVTVAAPGAAMLECATQLTAVMLRRCEGPDDLATLLEDDRLSALCLGPGLGVERARALIPCAMEAARATVLDADALTAFADAPGQLFEALHLRCVLTPHMGEFARLFPDIARAIADGSAGAISRADAARQAAERAGCTVLLKGPDTIIATPDGAVRVHLAGYGRGVPELATAGAGDVLAGLIAAGLARGLAPATACAGGAWLHVEAARRTGPGLIAEDLPEALPSVLSALSAAD